MGPSARPLPLEPISTTAEATSGAAAISPAAATATLVDEAAAAVVDHPGAGSAGSSAFRVPALQLSARLPLASEDGSTQAVSPHSTNLPCLPAAAVYRPLLQEYLQPQGATEVLPAQFVEHASSRAQVQPVVASLALTSHPGLNPHSRAHAEPDVIVYGTATAQPSEQRAFPVPMLSPHESNVPMMGMPPHAHFAPNPTTAHPGNGVGPTPLAYGTATQLTPAAFAAASSGLAIHRHHPALHAAMTQVVLVQTPWGVQAMDFPLGAIMPSVLPVPGGDTVCDADDAHPSVSVAGGAASNADASAEGLGPFSTGHAHMMLLLQQQQRIAMQEQMQQFGLTQGSPSLHPHLQQQPVLLHHHAHVHHMQPWQSMHQHGAVDGLHQGSAAPIAAVPGDDPTTGSTWHGSSGSHLAYAVHSGRGDVQEMPDHAHATRVPGAQVQLAASLDSGARRATAAATTMPGAKQLSAGTESAPAPGVRGWRCEHCGNFFRHSAARDRHTRAVHGRPGRHACPLCGDVMSSVSNMFRHVRRQHGIDAAEQLKRTRAAARRRYDVDMNGMAYPNE